MNKLTNFFILIGLFVNMLTAGSELFAQEKESIPSGKNKSAEKETKQKIEFSRIDSLVNCRQFVFQSEYNMSSDLVFVLVDSLYGAVQNGIRNNLQGSITQYEVSKNEKKRTLSVTIKLRGEIYSGDVFLFIGEYGLGKATIKSDSPGYFSFDGKLVDFEDARVNEWPSHFVH